MIDYIDKIASILSSLTIIIGSIILASSFRYKFDSEIRNLYIKNCETVREALSKITANGTASNDDYLKINSALLDAEIYLHKSIVVFLKELKEKIVILQMNEKLLETLPPGEERNEKTQKVTDTLIYIGEKVKILKNIYRKYIISEPFEKTK